MVTELAEVTLLLHLSPPLQLALPFDWLRGRTVTELAEVTLLLHLSPPLRLALPFDWLWAWTVTKLTLRLALGSDGH